ncbi:hypothetical protein FA95DRAFT_1610278 [Auriscalpium vulgare]|uniref:Uncharacterized protein n=1 Tax=Auriscalpium vulgare TaxID=40419 RepID=A0ACB8RF75_9AGAM|nr:hypothetical protein FA95DRAFT_1610278 [Auriscalpium vulgare]
MAFITETTDTCWNCNENPADLQRCPCCRIALYCDTACKHSAWEKHKRVCIAVAMPSGLPAAAVSAVRLTGGYQRPFSPEELDVPPEHEIWGEDAHVSPVSQLVGVPIKIWREAPELSLNDKRIPGMDNQSVKELMIQPENGDAAKRWNKNIGPVIIARANQEPLTIIVQEMIWVFCRSIIENFHDLEQPPWGRYNRAAFDKFCKGYIERAILGGRLEEFEGLEFPL